MALTKKAVLYLSLAYLFIGLALIFRQPSFAFFVIPIALILFYSSLFWHVGIPNLSVRRRLNPLRSFGQENIKVTVQIVNNLNTEIENLFLVDRIPAPLKLERGTSSLDVSLKPIGRAEYFYEISAPKRGRYVLGPMRAITEDLMGFRKYSVTVPGEDAIAILPRVDLKARRIGPWPGTIRARTVGPGTEFFELRLYSPGDELRRINWKASAKQRRLVTNEFETERVTDVLVVLDCSESVLSGLFPAETEEFEVSLAASLCSQLLLQGNRVGLLVYGAERTWVPPRFGKHQLLRILGNLTIAKAGRAIVPIDFAVETIVGAVLQSRSVIAFISPLLGDEIVEVIRNVAAKGYSTLCLTPAPQFPEADEPQPKVLARKILSAERIINLRQILLVSRCFEVSATSSMRALSGRGIQRRLA
jgi:uncharacterized protein (DUF58 family)